MDKQKRIEELLEKQKKYFMYKISTPGLKEILVGAMYRDIGVNRKILDVEFLRPNVRTSFQGLALLLNDNFWRFGCPLDAKYFKVPAIKFGQLTDIFAKLVETGGEKMKKLFKYDEDGDLCCAECGAMVRTMRIETHASIGLEHAQDEEFECVDWDYKDTQLVCVCGRKIPSDSYDWEYEDCWLVRVKPDAIQTSTKEDAEEAAMSHFEACFKELSALRKDPTRLPKIEDTERYSELGTGGDKDEVRKD